MITYNLAVSLTAQEQANYDYWQEVYTSTFARFSQDAALASSCIASKDNRLAYALSMGWHEGLGKKDRWSPQVLGKAANMWLKAGKHCDGIVTRASQKVTQTANILVHHRQTKALFYSDSYLMANAISNLSPYKLRMLHKKMTPDQRTIITTKHFKTKPDEVTTRIKTVGAATLRKEAVEAFADPASPVRVLCVSRLPDYDSRLRGVPLLINASCNTDITELLQPKVCVYLLCSGTYEVNKLLRKQRGQQVQEISSIHEITLPTI